MLHDKDGEVARHHVIPWYFVSFLFVLVFSSSFSLHWSLLRMCVMSVGRCTGVILDQERNASIIAASAAHDSLLVSNSLTMRQPHTAFSHERPWFNSGAVYTLQGDKLTREGRREFEGV